MRNDPVKDNAAQLAQGWIEAWINQDFDWLHTRLAEDFIHTSPFGRLEGPAVLP